MNDDLLQSLASFGRELGKRFFGEAQGNGSSSDTISEQVVEHSAKQAAYIFTSLGVAHDVDEVMFGRVVGVLAGSTSTLIAEMTGHEIPLTASAVPDACDICERAYIAMKR